MSIRRAYSGPPLRSGCSSTRNQTQCPASDSQIPTIRGEMHVSTSSGTPRAVAAALLCRHLRGSRGPDRPRAGPRVRDDLRVERSTDLGGRADVQWRARQRRGLRRAGRHIGARGSGIPIPVDAGARAWSCVRPHARHLSRGRPSEQLLDHAWKLRALVIGPNAERDPGQSDPRRSLSARAGARGISLPDVRAGGARSGPRSRPTTEVLPQADGRDDRAADRSARHRLRCCITTGSGSTAPTPRSTAARRRRVPVPRLRGSCRESASSAATTDRRCSALTYRSQRLLDPGICVAEERDAMSKAIARARALQRRGLTPGLV